MSGLLRFLAVVVIILCVILAALFVSLNDQDVAVWLGRDFAARPVGQWLIWSFVAGATVGLVIGFGFLRRVRYRMHIRQLEARIRELEKR